MTITMGRSGDRLRAQKAQRVTYTFTKEQLEARDRAIIQEYKETTKNLAKQEIHKQVENVFAEQEEAFVKRTKAYYSSLKDEFFSPDESENFHNYMRYLLSLSVRVLIERFGWKPISPCRTTRTERYATALLEELYKITENEETDIQTYSEETYQLYGVKFTRE